MIAELGQIRLMRKKHGITQSQLANLSNVSQSLIAKLEAGLIDPAYTKTKQIFAALEELDKKHELKAKDVMNKRVISVKPDDDIKAAIRKMKKYDVSQLVVTEGSNPLGLVSESTILDAILDGKAKNIKEIMKDVPPVIPEETGESVFTSLLKAYPLLLVSHRGRISGVIAKSDVLDRLYKK